MKMLTKTVDLFKKGVMTSMKAMAKNGPNIKQAKSILDGVDYLGTAYNYTDRGISIDNTLVGG